MTERTSEENIFPDCKHEKQFQMPDSLATVCEKCGQVFIEGEPWKYKSGNIMEWVEDLVQAKKHNGGAV